jgi:hypothetical protein
MQLLLPLLFTCGPALLSVLAFVKIFKEYRSAQAQPIALWSVGGILLVTAYAAYISIYYAIKPPPDSPPWKDPVTLDLGLLFLLAPIGLVLAVIARLRGASKWVVTPLVAALLVLFLVGCLAAASV